MSTAELLDIPEGRAPSAERIAAARAVLAAGGVVGLPTETVYGLAARADSRAALASLRAVKGRGSAPFTWHVAAAPDFGSLRALASRLTRRYWPGPLTLVREGVPEGLESVAHEGWTGVRMPAHEGTLAILAALDFPVVATSANPSGAAPLTDAAAVRSAFGPEVALVLDGGPSRLGESSSVLALGRGRFELLRAGLIGLDELRRAAGLRIAFVCTGNTCRSPMAEALARNALAERLGADPALFGFDVVSAGVNASPGAPPAEQALEVLRGFGIDASGHVSRPVVPEQFATLDHVYCLTRTHLDALLAALPPSRAEIVQLLDPAGEDVADPFGAPVEVYRECAARMSEMIEARLHEWV